MKLPTVRLHFHRSGNIQEQGEKKGKKVLDRNASDDDAGAATGTSIRKAVVVPLTITTSRLVLNGEVAGWLLWPILPSTSFPPAAVLLI